jgi:hypothetical protein
LLLFFIEDSLQKGLRYYQKVVCVFVLLVS